MSDFAANSSSSTTITEFPSSRGHKVTKIEPKSERIQVISEEAAVTPATPSRGNDENNANSALEVRNGPHVTLVRQSA